MKILYLSPWFPSRPGASSGNFILASAEAMLGMGHEILVLVAQPWRPKWTGYLHEDWSRPGLQVHTHSKQLQVVQCRYFSVPRNLSRWITRVVGYRQITAGLKKAITGFQPDLILAHTEQMGEVAVMHAKSSGLPVVTVLHGINTSRRLNTPRELAMLVDTLKNSKRVILVGEPLLSHFGSLVNNTENFRIVPNGFNQIPADLLQATSSWPEELHFISVSNLHAGKGIELTLQAMASLNRQGRDRWRYTIVGGGDQYEFLKKMVDQLQLQKQVVFVGAVDHSAVYPLLLQAHVFVLPSWQEAFGIAWLEAMACGLLAVGVKRQGPAAFITHRETGLLVNPRDIGSLTDALLQIIDRPDEMQAIARAGQIHAHQHYSWGAHALQLTQACKEASGKC